MSSVIADEYDRTDTAYSVVDPGLADVVQDPTTGLESQRFEHHRVIAPGWATQNYADTPLKRT